MHVAAHLQIGLSGAVGTGQDLPIPAPKPAERDSGLLYGAVAGGIAGCGGFCDECVGGCSNLSNKFIFVVNLSLTNATRHRYQNVKDARLRVGPWELVLEESAQTFGETIIERRRCAGVGRLNLHDQAVFDFSTSWQGSTMRLRKCFLKS